MNIAGIDEAGRGALAGPVVAGCVYIPEHIVVPKHINDSKQLTANTRQRAFAWISEHCLFGIGISSAAYIDAHGIIAANKNAMLQAFTAVQEQIQIDHLHIDGRDNFVFPIPSTFIIKGDCTETCISAASIIAKVTRDAMLIEQHKTDDRYAFNAHKGYGTKRHYEALKIHGLSSFHRQTFIHLDAQGNPYKYYPRNKNKPR